MELREFKRVLQQVMVLPILALLLLASVLIFQIREASRTVDLIEQSDLRIQLAVLIERLVIDEETGLRGYQITSDLRFLDPYRDASARMDRAVADLEATYQTGPSDNVKEFVAEHRLWQRNFAEPIIAAVAAGEPTSDDDINLTGRARMNSMRLALDSIVRGTESRRAERIADWQKQVRNSIFALILVALAIGLIIALFTRNRLEAVSTAFRRSLDLQRRRAELLYHSEQHLRTTLDSIGDAVITCDSNGLVQTMNPVAQELTGWTESEALNQPLESVFRVVNESSREPVENPVAKVKRLNRIVGLANHTILIRRDGSEIAVDDSGAPIRDQSGELSGVVMVFRDITLERRTRSALLTNEKLAVAGRLAATIAHEIHNPLDSVSNLLYLLQTGTTPEESAHFLELAQTELARVTQISRAMLSLYRESKAPVPIDLKETLEDLLLLMDRRFQEMRISVHCELPAGVVVEGFPAELRQVFTNLITNAAEAAGLDGKLTVRVTPRPNGVDPGSGKSFSRPGALIEIIDSGEGISPEVREHLFEPFFTTKGEKGTGLGLWVCQGIVRKHNGMLDLRNSTPEEGGRGTVASVFLAFHPEIDAGAV